MPGFVLHILHGQWILSRSKDAYDPQAVRQFMTGLLIPDSCSGDSKERSHFIPPEAADSILHIPDVNAFAAAYGLYLREPFVRGYAAHLWLDKVFFEDFFQRFIQFQDGQGQSTLREKDVRRVYLSRLNRYITVDELFSEQYLYGYYTALNRRLIDKYRLTIPEKSDAPIPVKEVRLQDFDRITDDLKRYFSAVPPAVSPDLFGQDALEDFLSRAADSFLAYERRMSNEQCGLCHGFSLHE